MDEFLEIFQTKLYSKVFAPCKNKHFGTQSNPTKHQFLLLFFKKKISSIKALGYPINRHIPLHGFLNPSLILDLQRRVGVWDRRRWLEGVWRCITVQFSAPMVSLEEVGVEWRGFGWGGGWWQHVNDSSLLRHTQWGGGVTLHVTVGRWAFNDI